MHVLIALVFIIAAVALAHFESKERQISFSKALFISFVLSPILGFIILSFFPKRTSWPCKWCGEEKRQAGYCGVCNKNEAGNLKPVDDI